MRVLIPVLYSRQLLPGDLLVLLGPLGDIPLLDVYSKKAKEEAPQSPLALLPCAVEHVILHALNAAPEDVQ